MDDYRAYFRALGAATKRPIFVQTSGGARNLFPSPELIIELAREAAKVLDCRMTLERLGEIEIARGVVLAEVRSFEQLLDQDHIGAALRGLADQLLRARDDIFDREAEVWRQILIWCRIAEGRHSDHITVRPDPFVPAQW